MRELKNNLNKYTMNINQEIEKEEMKVQNLVKDWHSQKLVSFIDDLIKKDRAEQLNLSGVSHRRELLDAFVCTMEFDTKHGTYQEDIDYFLEAHKSV